MNRAERRRKNRELIKKNNVNVVEARHMATDMASFAIGMLYHAFAMSLAFDFGKLQKKDTRMQTMLDLLDKYNDKITNKTLTADEKAICKVVDDLIVEHVEGMKNERNL
ncbi:MAG: hypothetical protein ACLT4X_02795 [Phascolarctobacterium sp.]|jgi:hypothetical protein